MIYFKVLTLYKLSNMANINEKIISKVEFSQKLKYRDIGLKKSWSRQIIKNQTNNQWNIISL